MPKARLCSTIAGGDMKEKVFTITVYSDPGHAWGKVKRDVLHNLGIARAVTHYSYQRGEYVYLEEDQDLSVLCQALNERGTKVKFVEKNTDKDSRIRSYERYSYIEKPDNMEYVVYDNKNTEVNVFESQAAADRFTTYMKENQGVYMYTVAREKELVHN